MTLNRDDYPDLTDEQWKALEAEVDRARTEASKTARENARKGMVAEADAEARVATALEAERERAKMDAAQLLDADRKALEEQQAALLGQERTFKARARLTEADLPKEQIEKLLPLFAGVDDKNLDVTLDAFITTHEDSVKSKVDAEKVALLGGATPPADQTAAPTDADAAAVQLAETGDAVGAADALLRQAGLVQ
jgi:hypothetical protein